MQSTINTITETVKPVIAKAVEKGTPVITQAIGGAISVVERIDPASQERQAVFATAGPTAEESASQEESKVENAAKADQAQEVATSAEDPFKELKVVTGHMLDLWLYEGSKGLKFVQESKAYQLTDPYVHYVEKFEAVKSRSIEAFGDLSEKVVLYYNEANNFIGMLIKVLTERQDELVDYVRKTYSNVQVFVQDNYLRLDFNKDGSVDMEDLRTSLQEFYIFLKNYDYIEASSRISSSLYDQAVTMIKRENAQQDENDKQKPSQSVEEGPIIVSAQDGQTENSTSQEREQKAQAEAVLLESQQQKDGSNQDEVVSQ